MAKILLDVILVEGTDKQEFVDSFNAETEADWWNMLGSMPTLIVMNVEEDYIETFRSHSSVVQATEIPEAFEASTPPAVEEMSKWMTSSTSSRDPSGDGEDNAPVQFIYDANQILPTDSNGNPISVGLDDDQTSTGKRETFSQRWTGKHVDIVTLEVGPVVSSLDGLHDRHPDWQKLPSEDDSHARTDAYWYQCANHSSMKGTITVNPANGQRNSYSLSVGASGYSAYTISGDDRNGTVSGNNPALVFNEGDTVTFSVVAPGHPFEIRTADGGAAINDGSITGQSSSGGDVVWTLRTSSRFIPMDWPDLEGASNNQVTNNNSALSSHGMGVLSVSGGTICGFAKKANLYAMYLVSGDSPTECIQACIDWHNAKPNNPETGVPNPTILIAEYQYLNDRRWGIPIDSVSVINKADGTTVNRPSGGWGTDYTEFVKENIIPWKVYASDTSSYEWCVVMPNQYHYGSLKTSLSTAWNNGIVCINAAGNNGGTYNKENSQTDTSIEVDATTPYRVLSISYGSDNSTTTFSSTSWYPFKSYGPHGVENNIDVAAGYNSEDFPGLDGYTNRGPGIDIVGLGAQTWSSYPSTTYGSYKWGMFSGTSCATPTVVGKAACIMEEYFWYNGAWPTPDQTKEILLSEAANKVRGYSSGGNGFSWSNAPAAGGYMGNTISFSNCRISGGGGNGGYTYTELTGTTQLRAYFDPQDWNSHPYTMRIKHHGKRPSTQVYSGPTYPRTNNAVGRHRIEMPELNI